VRTVMELAGDDPDPTVRTAAERVVRRLIDGTLGAYAFALGEDGARHIGVPVKRVKLIILITVSVLIGVCVSISGTVSFVGLIMPHIARMIVGPNHRRLLPASLFSGAVFLLLADLVSRVLLNPLELPIGVVTSFVGALLFVYIFYRSRRASQ